MMKAQAMIMPKKYFFDKDGNPLAYGKVYTYQAGTTINKETYTTENGDVANTNPVILNGEGYATIYLDGSYNIVVDDQDDNNIWTEDPVSSNVAEEWIGCEAVTYLSPSSFKVTGNSTGKYEPGRSVRVDNGVADYSYSTVKTSSFGGGETTVVLADAIVEAGVSQVCSSIVGPNSRAIKNVLNMNVLQDIIDSKIIRDGDIVETSGRNTQNDKGGATWLIVKANTVTPDTYGIIQCIGVGDLAAVIKIDSELDIRQIGVIGDGVVDDTNALNAALKYRNVIGGKGLKIRTTASIIIENELDFNLAGAEVLGETFLDAEPWFYFRHNNISMYGGTFGDGTVGGKPIVIGDYADPDIFYRDFSVCDNLFNIGEITVDKAFISGVGRVFELSVCNNRFQSAEVLTGNIACIFMQLSTASVDNTTQMSWKIENNICVGIPLLFNNFSSAFAANVTIKGNTIRDAEEGLRSYHLYECIVSNNTFVNCSENIYIWQRTHFTDNLVQDCGDGFQAVKIETPTSTVISGNDIRNSNGSGVLIDGGNSDFTFQDNAIWQSSASGLVINPNDGFGGQNIGTVIQGNRITQNFLHGIDIIVSSALRVMTIKDNYISGNGLDNPQQVAAIHVDMTGNNEVNELNVVGNVLRNNDIAGGISTANTQWALQFGNGTSFSSTSLFTNNIVHTPVTFASSKTGGAGTNVFANNYVPDIVDPQILGVVWFSNYDNVQQATSHRRTSNAVIGVLTPNFLGEECFSVNEQNWYKSVGSSTGPWTNADWKLITSP